MNQKRYTLRCEEDVLIALRRLAAIEERSMSAQLRILIKREALKLGVWRPQAPRVAGGTG